MGLKTEFVKFLGKGSFGSVDLVKLIKSEDDDDDGSLPLYAAVKTAKCEDYESLLTEIQTLSKLKGCGNIVQCYGNHTLEEDFDDDGFRVYKMAMEYASAGSLKTFMESYKDKRLPDTMIKDFTRMILQGLVFVHRHGFVHCDLKPDNLLVFPCSQSQSQSQSTRVAGRFQIYELKISDFGSSRFAGEYAGCWEDDNSFMGTPVYMSPESVKDGIAEHALDLWSLGCIVMEMYTGECPWSEVDDCEDLALLLLHGKAPEIPESVPCDARMFIQRCFSINPDERGPAYRLLLHPFLRAEQIKIQDTVISLPPPPPPQKSPKKVMKLKIIPPKPPQFKKVGIKHLKLKIIPPKPPAFTFIPVQ